MNFNYDFEIKNNIKSNNDAGYDITADFIYDRKKKIMEKAFEYMKKNDLEDDILKFYVKDYYYLNYKQMLKLFSIYLF